MEKEPLSSNEQTKLECLEKIRQAVDASGLQSDERHKFRLTPDRLELDMDCLRQFQAIGDFCVVYFRTLDEVYQKAVKGEFPPSANAFVRDALERSVTKGQRQFQQKLEGQQPLMFRTDCVLARDSEGRRRVYVTEIEGERPIGLGFEELANKMSQIVGNECVYQPMGGVNGLKLILEENREQFGNQPLAVILGEDQLFI